jgi:hypothetical protein
MPKHLSVVPSQISKVAVHNHFTEIGGVLVPELLEPLEYGQVASLFAMR